MFDENIFEKGRPDGIEYERENEYFTFPNAPPFDAVKFRIRSSAPDDAIYISPALLAKITNSTSSDRTIDVIRHRE